MRNKVDEFFDRIMPEPNSGCWLWTGGMISVNYGLFSFKGEGIRAHRFSWEYHYGPIPEGAMVLHRCDVPCCVNPDHLFLGSQSDNMKDAAQKGRLHVQKCPNESNFVKLKDRMNRARGELNCNAKLTADDVRLIRQSFRNGHRIAHIAKRYDVQRFTIYSIVQGKTWRHVQ